jgi:hypothetical protein
VSAAASALARLGGNLNRRDRQLLMICLGLVLVMVVVLAIFAPAKMQDDPVPSTYGTGNHGAKAAYLTLGKLGYNVERWTDPLNRLAAKADEHTVFITAEPFIDDPEVESAPIKAILDRGGRVLAVGRGALLLPHNSTALFFDHFAESCNATPVGFDSESGASRIRMRKQQYWNSSVPADRTEYACEGKPVVVEYHEGKGLAIWWADALPLENAGISMEDNLDFFLRSVGPAANAKVYWDESLHGETPSLWSYAEGTPVHLALLQLLLAAALLLLSYGRRSGPLRTDPVMSRASPLEFVRSLGGLFHKAHATNAAVDIANQHFRRQLQLQFGVSQAVNATDAARAIEKRLLKRDTRLIADLQAAENAAGGEPVKEGDALRLVQALEAHEERFASMLKPNTVKGN